MPADHNRSDRGTVRRAAARDPREQGRGPGADHDCALRRAVPRVQHRLYARRLRGRPCVRSGGEWGGPSRAEARTKVCQDVELATLRNGPLPTWPNGKPFSNHAKLVAVDDEAFYIGSQNLYPGRLQELGVIVEDRAAASELNFAYQRPMWDWSKADALINPATGRCGI